MAREEAKAVKKLAKNSVRRHGAAGLHVLRDWLAETIPDACAAVVPTATIKLATSCDDTAAGSRRIAEIVDWEMTTVGDPRAALRLLPVVGASRPDELPA